MLLNGRMDEEDGLAGQPTRSVQFSSAGSATSSNPRGQLALLLVTPNAAQRRGDMAAALALLYVARMDWALEVDLAARRLAT